MRIGWVGVSPFAKTGYGRMTREIVSRLVSYVHVDEILCIAHESDVIVWGAKKEIEFGEYKVTTLSMPNPMIKPSVASDIVRSYIAKYNLDLLIAHWDAFALEFLKSIDTPSLFYIPVDAEMTQKWANYISPAYKVVLYSKFAYDECKKYFPVAKLEYIPHGVDTEVFKPINRPKEELREEIRCSPKIPKDSFLFCTTAANIGARKQIPLLLRTFKKFTSYRDDAHIYLHTNAHATSPEGYDLPMLVSELGLNDKVHFPTYNPILEPVDDAEFCKIYNASDCMISNSNGEGFGLPILEAMSCGLPVIAPDNSSQTELVRDNGFLFRCVDQGSYVEYPSYVPTLQYFKVPDQTSLLEMMLDAYEFEDVRVSLGRKSRDFALKYDWAKIMPLWYRLIDELADELEMFKSVKLALK